MKTTFLFVMSCLFLQVFSSSPILANDANHSFILHSLEKAPAKSVLAPAAHAEKLTFKTLKKNIKEALKQRKPNRPKSDKRKQDALGWISLFSGALGFNLAIWSLIGSLSPAIGVLGFIILCGALVMGIISFIRIKKNPEKYKGAHNSLIAAILGTIGFIIVTLAFIGNNS